MSTPDTKPKEEAASEASPAVPKWKQIVASALEKFKREKPSSSGPPNRPNRLSSEALWMMRYGDRAEKRIGFLYLGSIVGILLVLFASGVFYYQKWKESSGIVEGKALDEFVARKAQEADITSRTANLGQFVFDLRQDETLSGNNWTSNTAQVDIFIECDTAATCKIIIREMTRLRDRISLTLTAVDRHDLLSHEGKNRIQDRLRDELNSALGGQNKVLKLYFNELIVD